MRLITLSLIRPTHVFPGFTKKNGWARGRNTVILQLSSLHCPLNPTRPSAHAISLSPRPGWTHRRGTHRPEHLRIVRTLQPSDNFHIRKLEESKTPFRFREEKPPLLWVQSIDGKPFHGIGHWLGQAIPLH